MVFRPRDVVKRVTSVKASFREGAWTRRFGGSAGFFGRTRIEIFINRTQSESTTVD